METSQEINEIAKALAAVQKTALLALKDSNNPFFKSKYADLSSVWGVLREPLTDNGLSVAQPLGYAEDGAPIVYTLLMHTSGQWIKGECRMRPEKDTPQALGSCVTYSRRYSLASICGVCPEDDDGESATQRSKTTKKKELLTKPTPPKKQFTTTTETGFSKDENICTPEQARELGTVGAPRVFRNTEHRPDSTRRHYGKSSALPARSSDHFRNPPKRSSPMPSPSS